MTEVPIPRFDPVVASAFRSPIVEDRVERIVADVPTPAPEDVRATLRQIIRELGERGGVIIVGRGANFVLQMRPDVLRVRLVAPLDDRIDRVVTRLGLERSAAIRELRERDESRRHFVRAVHEADWEDPTNYDLVLNTASMTIDGAVATAADAAQTKTNRHAVPA